MQEFANYIAGFVIHWTGIPMLRLIILALACLLLLVTIIAIWNRRIRALNALICLLTGSILLTIAVYPGVIKLFIQIEYITRVRMAVGFLSLVVLVITFEALRLTKMQERYALLWVTTGIIILVFALLPQIVYMFGKITGMPYVDAIVSVIITFLLLVAFHFSIAMSRFQNHQSILAQQQAILSSRVEVLETELGISHPVSREKNIYKSEPDQKFNKKIEKLHSIENRSQAIQRASFILMVVSFLAILGTGLATPSPMIGDEVTHYYMLRTQSERLPEPNFIAEIPLGNGGLEKRKYPHVFMWHYLGAIVTKLLHGGVRTVQLYHSLFLIQFLLFGYLLVRLRTGRGSTAPLIYLLSCISLPMLLIFSVAFYQDVPLTAQIVTTCYFLQRRRWLLATLFTCFGLTLKVTGILLVPAFIGILLVWGIREKRWGKFIFRTGIITVLLFSTMFGMAWSLKKFGDAEYYPIEKLNKIVVSLTADKEYLVTKPAAEKNSQTRTGEDLVSAYEMQIIANHPGDLRNSENFLIYGGVLIWFMAFIYVVHLLIRIVPSYRTQIRVNNSQQESCSWWIWLMGGSFIAFSYVFIRTAPDARFFLPGVMLIMLPISEYIAGLSAKKFWMPVLIVIALLQTGMVLKKVYTLRHVSPEIIEAINFLKQDKKSTKMFMYPEGNYRLFPLSHDWYLDYKLREFWRGDNDFRIKLLNDHAIDTIVIKKHLIAQVSEEIINLGVYPTYFVDDLRKDSRFKKIFENSDILIYRVPRNKPNISNQ